MKDKKDAALIGFTCVILLLCAWIIHQANQLKVQRQINHYLSESNHVVEVQP